jgi:hypothetical protein
MNSDSASKKPVLSPGDIRRRRSRSIAIALVLGAFVLLFYLVTIAKLGPQILNRPL